jgi:outer membrane protein OmpA-like peptidoglycan-associated protein
MNQRLTRMLASSGLTIASLCACATTRPPPPELQRARAEVQRTRSSPEAQSNPAGFIEARQALDMAEGKYQQEQTSKDVDTLGYVALRKVEIAEADGRSAMLAERTAEKEQQAFGRSERRAKVALGRLGLAAKEDSRGTVITLPTSNMFAVDDAQILPSARDRLVKVAGAVKEVLAENAPQDAGRRMKLVGFTDDTGTEEHNLDLSKRRAESVRTFFSEQGLDAATIDTDGKGEANPIADNTTAAGRAQNRRVEIVVTPPESGTGGAD